MNLARFYSCRTEARGVRFSIALLKEVESEVMPHTMGIKDEDHNIVVD